MSDILKDLIKVDVYPEKTSKVELVQTHISSVFICDEYVYKVKKSVNFGFLDFSTLEKRKYYCEKEVELNSRFSDGVYLGVVPIIFGGDSYKFGSDGEVVEYAVKMKRLSDDFLLKNKLKEGQISDSDLFNVSKLLAKIHSEAKTNDEISQYGSLESVKKNTDENFEQIAPYIGTSIDETLYTKLKDWTEIFYKDNKDLFNERADMGKIRDCHGDLHMEHIYLLDPIVIVDCIEFNERFRYADVLSDLAFLLMDLEFNERNEEAKKIYETYIKESNETSVDHLVKFYKIYRAFVRGKVTSFLLDNSDLSEEKRQEIINKSKKYFGLADTYTK